MAGVRDKELIRFAGWPRGVNNRTPETSLPTDDDGNIIALRSAVNIDLSNEGKPSRRAGNAKRKEGSHHSVYSDGRALFAVKDSDLLAYDADLNPTTIRAGIGERDVAWCAIPAIEMAWWTNGYEFRCIGPDLVDLPLAPPSLGQCAASPIAGAGGLHAGTYQVACTWVDAYGREGGATLTVEVDVEEGGGIEVSGIPDDADAVEANIYVSEANGEVLYLARSIPLPATTQSIGIGHIGNKRKLETQWLEPLPPGHMLAPFAGRLMVARENVLYWSEAMRYGLGNLSKNYMRLGGRCSLLQPVGEGEEGAGIYIADHKRTYFQTGADPKDWRRAIRYPHGAVEGTGLTVPASLFGGDYTGMAAFWLASNGVFCLGLPSGQVVPLTEKTLALPGFERGAALLREIAGKRAILTAMTGPTANAFAISDSYVAEVHRHGAAAL